MHLRQIVEGSETEIAEYIKRICRPHTINKKKYIANYRIRIELEFFFRKELYEHLLKEHVFEFAGIDSSTIWRYWLNNLKKQPLKALKNLLLMCIVWISRETILLPYRLLGFHRVKMVAKNHWGKCKCKEYYGYPNQHTMRIINIGVKFDKTENEHELL